MLSLTHSSDRHLLCNASRYEPRLLCLCTSSVSLAASVLRLEIRRHKARGGGALSDPLNGSGCAGGEMRDWFDALSTFDSVTARGCTAARRASTSFGEQLWLSISDGRGVHWQLGGAGDG